MKKFSELLEVKKEHNTGYRVTKREVYDLERLDDFGRWIRHSSHDSKEKAYGKIKSAKAAETRLKNDKDAWSSPYLDPGRNRIPRTPHGDGD